MNHHNAHGLIHKHPEGMGGTKHGNRTSEGQSCSQQEHKHENPQPRSQTGTGIHYPT